jgi:phage repressor protein C with HTH and peptisase S24 domain
MNKPVPPRQLLQLAGEVISRGGHFCFHTTGHSMYPAIAHGDRVILGPLLGGTARVGDVVLAETQEGPRLHRVISIGTKSSGSAMRKRARESASARRPSAGE